MKKLASAVSEDKIKPIYIMLHSYGVPVSVTREGERFHLWLLQPAFEAHARELMQQFAEHPERFNTANEIETSVLAPLWRTLAKQAGPVTFIIAFIVLAVGLLQQLSSEATLKYLLIAHPNFQHLNMSEPWRIITPAFLHFSATHLVFNLFWWWYLGGRIELYLGSKMLIGLFFVTGIAANITQFYWQGPLFGGLSGVVYGLLGFAMVMSAKRGGPLWLPPMLLVFMVGWLLLGYTNALPVNMANDAHLAGLISGIIAGAFVRFGLQK
ncbi:rhomboid family intramembrane serine protease [Aliidiomarina quisquiliarum]|uniref:rhomboid family intramembrane serine protease n=1 Tax=Aliidiomarina quisquiliarum TaxID=2938947 RepID=UPI00208E789E|nr:rhomboid family intramembrane serine protease [Aliidiomarina quisquiliarum]MCO4322234.1 rhomboid family intramembrane serine protease [Aliidiomarina quisquiliarum]